VTRTPDPATQRGASPRDRTHLLVCEGDRGWVVELSHNGTIEIGRASECAVVLADPAVSRVHANLTVRDGRGTLEDRGSQNGTHVNGAPVTTRELHAGDVIEIGAATLVFHSTTRVREPREVDEAAFRREVEREIERTRVSRRGFTVLAMRVPGRSADQLRALVVGNLRAFEVAAAAGPDELLVLCPEQEASAPAELATIVGVLGAVQIGYAACPHDGFDAAVLIAAARGAMAHVPAGRTSEPAAHRRMRAGELDIVVAEPATLQLYALVERLARSDIPVLVRGETGVGKEVVAQALHAWSPRARGRFVAINCAALPEQLAESELFGHERGAFSGAVTSKLGLLEAARGGTVLLDEVGDMTLATQAKLLRVLETKRVTRLGSVEDHPIDIRLLAATHRDLDADVVAGRFRRDLFYRLTGGTLILPPLRDRPRELVILAEAFLATACSALCRAPMILSDDAIVELLTCAWPGNVRELKHVMDYLAAAEPGGVVLAAHVRQRLGTPTPPAAAPPVTGPAATRAPLRDELADLERRRIVEALDAHDGHQSNAAAALGIPLRTFVAKLKRYNVRAVRR
jgi:DNA-binding NtrC family response regulator/pSer/pThr/pTyr-binding forkhead associated (FHA) protein